MKKSCLIGFLFALLWCAVKFFSFLMDWDSPDSLKYFALLNMFLGTICVVVAIFSANKIKEERNLLMDVKSGMASGLIYAICVSAFIFLYYDKINVDYNKNQIEKYKLELSKQFDKDPKQLSEFRNNKPEWKSLSKAELVDEVSKDAAVFYNPKTTMILCLSGMLLWITLNSIIIAIVLRKFIFKSV